MIYVKVNNTGVSSSEEGYPFWVSVTNMPLTMSWRDAELIGRAILSAAEEAKMRQMECDRARERGRWASVAPAPPG